MYSIIKFSVFEHCWVKSHWTSIFPCSSKWKNGPATGVASISSNIDFIFGHLLKSIVVRQLHPTSIFLFIKSQLMCGHPHWESFVCCLGYEIWQGQGVLCNVRKKWRDISDETQKWAHLCCWFGSWPWKYLINLTAVGFNPLHKYVVAQEVDFST